MSLCNSHKCELKYGCLLVMFPFTAFNVGDLIIYWDIFTFQYPPCVCVTVLITHLTCKNKWNVYNIIYYIRKYEFHFMFLIAFLGSTSHCQCCIWEVFQIFHCIKRPCCSWNNTHDVLVLFLLSHFVDIALLDWHYSWVWWCRLHKVILERVSIIILIFALSIPESSLRCLVKFLHRLIKLYFSGFIKRDFCPEIFVSKSVNG